MKEEGTEREDNFEDEIKPEDGLLRYWIFFNGEEYRLFAALAAAFFGVVWCGLYIFGAGQSILGTVLLVLALLSPGGCWTGRCGSTNRAAGRSNHRRKKEVRFVWSLDFGYLFS